jgi:hypothetical protein
VRGAVPATLEEVRRTLTLTLTLALTLTLTLTLTPTLTPTLTNQVSADALGKTEWQYFRHHNSDFLGMGLVKVALLWELLLTLTLTLTQP